MSTRPKEQIKMKQESDCYLSIKRGSVVILNNGELTEEGKKISSSE